MYGFPLEACIVHGCVVVLGGYTGCIFGNRAASLFWGLNEHFSSQLTINTAIVYMHRFYMIQSFTQFHRNVSILLYV